MAEKTTIGAYLMHKSGTSWAKLIAITEYPNMGSEPEKIDISTLDSKFRKYAQGMVDTSDLTFTAIYDTTDVEAIEALTSEETFALFFDEPDLDAPTGTHGKYYWKGTVAVTEQGAGTNSARTVSVAFYPTTPITKTEPAST